MVISKEKRKRIASGAGSGIKKLNFNENLKKEYIMSEEFAEEAIGDKPVEVLSEDEIPGIVNVVDNISKVYVALDQTLQVLFKSIVQVTDSEKKEDLAKIAYDMASLVTSMKDIAEELSVSEEPLEDLPEEE